MFQSTTQVAATTDDDDDERQQHCSVFDTINSTRQINQDQAERHMNFSNNMPIRPGAILDREEVERMMVQQQAQQQGRGGPGPAPGGGGPGIMCLDDTMKDKMFHSDCRDDYYGKIIIGRVDEDGTTVHPEGVMGQAGSTEDVVGAETAEARGVNLCWHGTEEQNYSNEYQQMLDDFLEIFKKEDKKQENNDKAGVEILVMATEEAQRKHESISRYRYKKIGKHAFACSAKWILYGGRGNFWNAFNACAFGLYFRYIPTCCEVPAHKQQESLLLANQRFHLYIRRMLDGCGGSRRGVIRVLAKHLPCTCVKDVKPYLLKVGRKVKLCDGCNKLKLADKPSLMKDCSQCKMASYCSVQCQRMHWKNGHKEECVLMKSS